MGYLKIDHMGRIYETSSDEADGSGFKGYAGESSCGDVTFGAVYLKNAQAQRVQNIREKQLRDIEDRHESFEAMRKKALKRKKARIEQAEMELLDNEKYQESLMKKALNMGNCSEVQCSGGLSANGLLGYAGMDHTQKAIHQHMGLMGASGPRVAHEIDELEKQQAFLNQQAQRQIEAEARKQAALNKAEYKQNQATQKLARGEKRFLSARPQFPQFKVK